MCRLCSNQTKLKKTSVYDKLSSFIHEICVFVNESAVFINNNNYCTFDTNLDPNNSYGVFFNQSYRFLFFKSIQRSITNKHLEAYTLLVWAHTYSWCFDTERDELLLPRDSLFLYSVLNHKWLQMVSYW